MIEQCILPGLLQLLDTTTTNRVRSSPELAALALHLRRKGWSPEDAIRGIGVAQTLAGMQSEDFKRAFAKLRSELISAESLESFKTRATC